MDAVVEYISWTCWFIANFLRAGEQCLHCGLCLYSIEEEMLKNRNNWTELYKDTIYQKKKLCRLKINMVCTCQTCIFSDSERY